MLLCDEFVFLCQMAKKVKKKSLVFIFSMLHLKPSLYDESCLESKAGYFRSTMFVVSSYIGGENQDAKKSTFAITSVSGLNVSIYAFGFKAVPKRCRLSSLDGYFKSSVFRKIGEFSIFQNAICNFNIAQNYQHSRAKLRYIGSGSFSKTLGNINNQVKSKFRSMQNIELLN